MLLGPVSAGAQARDSIRVGWFDWPPFSTRTVNTDVERLTGIDIEIARHVFVRLGMRPDFVRGEFRPLTEQLRTGHIDVLLGMFRSADRAAWGHFSAPYRTLECFLYLSTVSHVDLPQHTRLADLAQDLARRKARIGVAFPSQGVEAFKAATVAEPHLLVWASGERALMNLLRVGQIDGFIGSHLVIHTHLWSRKGADSIREYPLMLGVEPVHMLFSHKTVSEALVASVNREIVELHRSGTDQRITRQHLLPVLLSMTLARPWFFAIEVLGTVAFAMSGLILARREHYGVIGALVLAALPAMGGGIVRDLILGRHPVWVFRSPVFVLLVVGTVLGSFLVIRLIASIERRTGKPLPMPSGVLEISDALGLAAFTVAGVLATLETGVEQLWLWGTLLAPLTAAGGGIIRDALRSDIGNPLLKGEFYAEIAAVWGLALSIYLTMAAANPDPDRLELAVFGTLLGAFLTRVAVVHFKVRSPLF